MSQPPPANQPNMAKLRQDVLEELKAEVPSVRPEMEIVIANFGLNSEPESLKEVHEEFIELLVRCLVRKTKMCDNTGARMPCSRACCCCSCAVTNGIWIVLFKASAGVSAESSLRRRSKTR